MELKGREFACEEFQWRSSCVGDVYSAEAERGCYESCELYMDVGIALNILYSHILFDQRVSVGSIMRDYVYRNA